jgi:hypothetical protein
MTQTIVMEKNTQKAALADPQKSSVPFVYSIRNKTSGYLIKGSVC